MKFLRPILLAASVALIADARASVTIAWVTVGDAGNAADPTTGYGAVAYEYQIGKYEVTNAEYTAFLNAVDPEGANANGVYNVEMGSNARSGIAYTAGAASGAKYTIRTSMGDKPVNQVSWYDAARFTNWLHNGQGSGSTETGAYTLSGNTGIITKNEGATVYLPSEDEWYKAAYYDPTTGAGGGDNYWAYATQSNTAPTVGTANSTGVISNPGANVANYNTVADWNGQDGNVTTVSSAGAGNYFGTADQAGNVNEWTDAVSSSSRLMRGGSFYVNPEALAARYFDTPIAEAGSIGFRVASVPVPEPSAFIPAMLICVGVLMRRRR
jgi:formylglycine-generating enzyme required for sulfatase activity